MLSRAINAVFLAGVLMAAPIAAQDQTHPELISPLGVALFATPADGEAQAKLLADLEAARTSHAENPDDPERAVAHGRALGYLWRYHEAIAVFTSAIEKNPEHAMLYRHRGHRYISIRNFAAARADLARAAELKQDDFDIWYHLALAHFLLGETAPAAESFRRAYECVDDDDSRIAALYWHYLSSGAKADISAVRADMDVKENTAYHRLLLCFKGEMTEESVLEAARESALDSATTHFGLGYRAYLDGERAQALEHFKKAVVSPYWPAFGYISAETMLVRLGWRP